ncbi:ser thr protein phosphatase family protein [Ophiostoma piceae UAMH 11346]|uniref:Ser thr protein phosphatase family protein n=1 Tax=Ophiostoma piceae (strain UAMH 11346) TaxID=1262450 RepID=S3CXY9_OPHP1|nr:ser thr protein phosphatase family protein [Ophiostoma piceae UAMH 11346]
MRPRDPVRGASKTLTLTLALTVAVALVVFTTASVLLVILFDAMKPISLFAVAAAATAGLAEASSPSSNNKDASKSKIPGVSSFAVPVTFPTAVFSSYYVKPGPSVEPQPVVRDPVSGKVYPLNLTSPYSIPNSNSDPLIYPVSLANLTEPSTEAVIKAATQEILSIISANSSSSGLASNCSRCIAALSVGQMVARLAPAALPDAMISLCETTGFASNATCQLNYAADVFGAAWTQILAAADVTGLDGQYICASLSTKFCPTPSIRPVKAVFPKPRPTSPKVHKRSGNRVKVLHMSDLHLDARYQVGSEGNCTSGMCCRPSSVNAAGAGTLSVSAPLFGTYKCDSPYFLALAAMQAIGPLTGTSAKHPPAFSFYTGDLVAHDPANQLSHDYVEYVESSLWQIFKEYIGGPIYCALGNHDTAPDNLDAPHAIDGNGAEGRQFSWNYQHVSSLWQHYGWIDKQAAADAALHYGAYSVVDKHGVRIITINTDLYYKSNYYAYLHAADPDYSGIFTFLISELQKAEDAGQRAYVVGHVLTGWDGTNALPNGADLFYQIIDRYSPHVVASVFFGHTHEDQAFVYYSNNATKQTAEYAVANAWVGPSITPLTNLNSGFRMYEVDTGSFEIMDAYTFYADVSSFADIKTGDAHAEGPVYKLEYSTREAYGAAANWPADAPLNATFWHRVTEALEADKTNKLVSQMNTYQGKSSVRSPNCTSDACAAAKVCYMRSGSSALGLACPQGFASVQSPFTGKNF